jgi:hypothetical protein
MAQSAAGRSSAPLRDGSRDEPRAPYREINGYTRIRPAEPHEKYALDPADKARGMDYFWAAITVRGAPNRDRLNDFYRAGWKPARAADHPTLSGFDIRTGASLEAFGINPVAADDPVVRNGLMLCQRPVELSDESNRELDTAAHRQIDDHLASLSRRSERAIGGKTRIQRNITRSHTPPPDFPDDDGGFGDDGP